MAMVKCPECGREASARAEACPACGFPIRSDIAAKEMRECEAQARMLFAEFVAQTKDLSEAVFSSDISFGEADECRTKVRASLTAGQSPGVRTALDALFADWSQRREATREQARADCAAHFQVLRTLAKKWAVDELSDEEHSTLSDQEVARAEAGKSAEYLEFYRLARDGESERVKRELEDSKRALEESEEISKKQGELSHQEFREYLRANPSPRAKALLKTIEDFEVELNGRLPSLSIAEAPTTESVSVDSRDNDVVCPSCGALNAYHAGPQGVSLGKAALGGFLIGPLGWLGGVVGRKKLVLQCLKCGRKWSP